GLDPVAVVFGGAFFGVHQFDRVVDADEVVGDQAEHAFFRRLFEVVVDHHVVGGGDRQRLRVFAFDVDVAAGPDHTGVGNVEGRVFAAAEFAGVVDHAVAGEGAGVERRFGARFAFADPQRRAAEADLDFTAEAEARFGDGRERGVGFRRDQGRGADREGAFEVRFAAAAAGAGVGDFRGGEPTRRFRGAGLDRVQGAAAKGRFFADHEGVVGVHRALDVVAADEGDRVAVDRRAAARGHLAFAVQVFAFFVLQRERVAAFVHRLRALAAGRLDQFFDPVGDRVRSLALGEVDVVEEALRFEGRHHRDFGFAVVPGRPDAEGAAGGALALQHARGRRFQVGRIAFGVAGRRD